MRRNELRRLELVPQRGGGRQRRPGEVRVDFVTRSIATNRSRHSRMSERELQRRGTQRHSVSRANRLEPPHALDDFLPLCASGKQSVIVASPFNSGILATGAVEGARYFYEPAPAPIVERVRRLEAVCARYAVPLGAAALQFTLGHPAVTTAVCGYRSRDEVDTNLAWSALPTPAALWDELKSAQLIPSHAPTPRGAAPT